MPEPSIKTKGRLTLLQKTSTAVYYKGKKKPNAITAQAMEGQCNPTSRVKQQNLLSDAACSSRTDSSAPCTEAYPDDAVSLWLSTSLIEVTFEVPLDTVACTDSAPSSASTCVKKRKW